MKPLSGDDSQRLFYKRIFSHESGCPPELEVLSKDILNKCGGVPLAIITIASLLASDQQVKPEGEWRVLLKSIGRGLTEDPSVEEMLRILSFSYYDLPSHLKTCLLYLSMFPEDYNIRKDRLIWMWIAENFVRCDKAEASAFEIGETYYNELVNRNMIMVDKLGTICHVHDMVLDLISSLSSEENFVTVLNGTGDSLSSRSNVRRLSLQNARKEEFQTAPLQSVSMSQVRSVAAFEPAIDLMPPFSRLVVLRVLDLTDCDLSNHDHLNLRDLGSLLHLRYLSLANTQISKLPEEVGNLKFLQVLDLRRNDDMELPSTIIKLRNLMCLLTNSDHKRLPDGLGNLTSLEVLGTICCISPNTAKELGCMERLRKLVILFGDMSLELEEAFVESLGKLSIIQSIEIFGPDKDVLMDILSEHWVAPPTLQEFITRPRLFTFSLLPAWISPHLSQLCRLEINLVEVGQKDMDILASLPRLRRLVLQTKRQSRLLLVGADGFCGLTSFELYCNSPGQVMFQPGGMPKAETVWVDIGLRFAKEEGAGIGGDLFGPGLENLPSLRYVRVEFDCVWVTVGEAKQAKAALENALRAHLNRPVFGVAFWQNIPQGT
jgi:Leucine-rich repeat (LRR) protein